MESCFWTFTLQNTFILSIFSLQFININMKLYDINNTYENKNQYLNQILLLFLIPKCQKNIFINVHISFYFYPSPHFLFIISTLLGRFSSWFPSLPLPIPRIPTLIPCFPTLILHPSTLIPIIPTLLPRIPTWLSHSHHSHSDSLHSHPHSPHSVPRFPIPAFTDSR